MASATYGHWRYKGGAAKTGENNLTGQTNKLDRFRGDAPTFNMRKVFGRRENIGTKEKENVKPDENSEPIAADQQKTQAALDEKSRQLYAMQFKLTLCKSEIANKDEELNRQKASLTSLKNLFDKKKESMEESLEENKKQFKTLALELNHLEEKLANMEADTTKKLKEQDVQIVSLSKSLASKEEEVKQMKKNLTILQIQTQEQKLLNEKLETKDTELNKKLLKSEFEFENLLVELAASKLGLEQAQSDFKTLEESFNYKLENMRKENEDENALMKKKLSEMKNNSLEFPSTLMKLANKDLERFSESFSLTHDDPTIESQNLSSLKYHTTLRKMTDALTALLEASKVEIAFLKSVIAGKDAEIQMLMDG